MNDEMMSPRALLEKGSETDLPRETIGFAAHRLREREVESLTGATHGERSRSYTTTGTRSRRHRMTIRRVKRRRRAAGRQNRFRV
jgi:hypothetical protein